MQHMAKVFMVDDKRSTLDDFAGYCKRRGDIQGSFAQFSLDVIEEIKEAKVDLVLLDVRLAELPKELAGNPAELPPRGAKIAEDLYRDPETTNLPVVLYTQYAIHPEVQKALENCRRRCRNIVHLITTIRQAVRILDAGLPYIRTLDVSIEPGLGPLERVLKFGDGFRPQDIEHCTVLLNGHAAAELEVLKGKSEIYAWFKQEQFNPGHNYIVVQAKDGRKSLFRA